MDSIHKPIPVTIKEIRHMGSEEKDKWIKALVKELESLLDRKTFVKLTKKQANDLYWRNGIKTKNLPSKIVCVEKNTI